MTDQPTPKRKIFFKKRRLGEDETLDQLARDSLGGEEKFTQAWEMVVQAHLIKGGTLDELQFQKSVGFVGRRKS